MEQLLLLSLTHLLNDFLTNVIPPILPLLIAEHGLSLAMAGSLLTTVAVVSGLGQPILGHFVDRHPKHWLLPATTVATAGFIALLGFAQGYYQLIILVALMALGSGVFHPIGALMARRLARQNAAVSMSIFTFGGTAGMAIAPIVTTLIVVNFGLKGLGWLIVPALLMSALIVLRGAHRLPVAGGSGAAAAAAQPGTVQRSPIALRRASIQLGCLATGLLLRMQTNSVLVGFMTIYFAQQGYPDGYGARMLTMYMAIGALSGVAFAYISDRIGRRPVLLVSQVLVAPFLLGFATTTGVWQTLFLAGTAMTMFSTSSAAVAQAQELMPERPAMAASLIMGFIWGTAGIGVTAIGALADHIGLSTTFAWLALSPLLGLPLLLAVPETLKRRRLQRAGSG